MKFMFIVKADADTEAGVMPPQSLIAEMAAYHEALQEAGVLVDANGLRPSAQGFRVRYEGDRRTVVDGPFAETKELVAGYTIIDVASRAQAVAWASRFPNPHPGKTNEIEVRPFYALEDFEPGEGVDRFRALDAERAR
ncbi:MAG: YciI family protein [Burkholderiales bacterium]|nr:YciI family protein [Burkholderiales bacterium]